MIFRPLSALLIGSFALLMWSGCDEPERADVAESAAVEVASPEVLHAAVKKLTDVMIHDIFSPPQAARAYAYASIAAYEAAAPGAPELASLAGQLNGLEPGPSPHSEAVDLDLAGAHAFLRVAEALVFSEAEIAMHRDDLHARYRAARSPDVVQASVVYGDAVADHVLAWAGTDGYKETRSAAAFTVTDAPGRWQPTPPAYMDGIEPSWATLRPFVLASGDQFRPAPPHAYSLDPESPFFRQVVEVYEIGRSLTDEQRLIASFWDCNPYTMHTRGHAMFATKKITPGGHWMGIAGIAARTRELDFAHSAETYARTAVALSDAFISAWDEKYRSNLIRPETVINAHLDEAWVPLLQTPPFPEYTSGHSVISAAAATVLTDYFGDGFAFNDTTEVEYGLPARAFPSFNAAAEEAALSRLYGGIHYRMAADEGLNQGRAVGAHVVGRLQTRAPALAAHHETPAP